MNADDGHDGMMPDGAAKSKESQMGVAAMDPDSRADLH